MKFTKISAVASAAVLALGAAACGGGSDDTKADGPETITYWSWLGGADTLVDAFNKSQTRYKVVYEKIPAGGAGGYDKMNAAIKAGQVPDVVNIEYNALPEFASQGNVAEASADLTSYVGTLPEGVKGLATLGGKVWGVPRDAAPQVLYYRKDLFTKYGIEVPKTWAEFTEAAGKVKKADKSVRLSSFWKDDATVLAGFVWQAGGRWYTTQGDGWKVSYDDPNSKKVGDYWTGLIKDDLVRGEVSYSPEWTKNLVDGKTLTVLGASWNAGSLRDLVKDQAGKWALAPMPSWDGKPASGMVGGTVYAELKGVKHRAAADAFIEFAASTPESLKAQLGSGTSSALPADPALVDAAKAGFDSSFYGGQDVYALTSAQVASIVPGWTWGPVQVFANAKMKDAAASGDITASLTAGQDAATGEIKSRGLTLAP
ncbi:sugar ABC transporter substrate-binding protein [Actinocorallia longicatena]|uniref:Sugar ABC transporter substrate-binding protein n=1 Tax=Actinocorallia longicatena TaxID=111803 RepID=A0ABP6QQ99_9ACTN